MSEPSKVKAFFARLAEFVHENKVPIALVVGASVGAYATRKVDSKLEAARLAGREEAEEDEE